MNFTRREGLAMGAVIALGGGAMLASPARAQAADGLNALAMRSGRRFGSAIGTRPRQGGVGASFDDPAYRALMVAQCGVLVPENELKWGWVRARPAGFDFAAADGLMRFADANRLAMRGHTLLWLDVDKFPPWLVAHDFGPRPAVAAARMLAEHIGTLCRRYARIHSWDVVNEPVNPATGVPRETPFSRAMGGAEEVIHHSFVTARAAAPHAQLVCNDYMSWGADSATHCAGTLRLLEALRRRGTPVDALGIQAHIGPGGGGGVADAAVRIDSAQEGEWRRFLDAVVAMGFGLEITEFDVHDRFLPAAFDVRDRAVADYARAYLDLMLSYPAMGDILAWGLGDRYSWLRERWPRADGLSKRACPYDDELRPKPLREAIAAALRGATPRRAA